MHLIASRRISFLFIVAYIVSNFVAPCLGCGTHSLFSGDLTELCVGGLVHGELTQRAKYLFMLKNNPPNGTEAVDEFSARVAQWLHHYESSVLAGMFMPDWYLLPFSAHAC